MAEKGPVALTLIQRLIGRRMLESKRTKPCVHMRRGVDVTELMALRPVLKKSLGVKITTNAFYIRAVALAAAEFPLVMGRFEGGVVRIPDTANVGFAVNAPQGLVVPVITAAGRRSLGEIALLEKALTDKARANALTLEDVEGQTIALSNLGVYGVDSFVGIVPPPASTIAAFGNVGNAALPAAGGASVRRMLELTVSCDSRVVGSLYAAAFLNLVRDFLEKPENLSATAVPGGARDGETKFA
jgi:pyruvate dehydrogenase E2 component (dihydrolipoamide acetyltransferase)